MTKTTFLFAALLLTAGPLFAQTEKGARPINQSTNPPINQTRAVVVGISDYQDPGIPDLRFADKDALAFANFLRSPAGGALDGDHLQVLTNQNATAGRVAEALDALLEQAKEGDLVIIYFSGHGDVERKTVSQPGFLLCWDAPSRVYMGGGTYSLAYLQEVLTTLSTQNQAKVVVVTDACHAGKLAGSQIGGAQLTAANLARQFSNEVKILSCQPGELSLEGEQWGGGRGIFSYHLVDGLFGLADRNGDGSVTLGELDRYLEDKVTAEAAPQSQVPMLLGKKTEPLAVVNAQILADLQKAKAGRLPVFAATEGRGLEEEILSKVDSSVREMYVAFKKAVVEKRFFRNVGEVSNLADVGSSADELYALLAHNQSLAPLQGMMRRNYAAALQDDAQQWLNDYLKDPRFSGKKNLDLVRPYPRRIARAAELLGEKHYMYPMLRAQECFFEGKLAAPLSLGPNRELGEKALTALRTSLQWVPDQPHVILRIGHVYQYMFQQVDSAEWYFRRAVEHAPSWVLPLTQLASLYFSERNCFEEAKTFLLEAESLDSASVDVAYWWTQFYEAQNDALSAERYYKKCIMHDPANSQFHTNLGLLYLNAERFAEARERLEEAIRMDAEDAESCLLLGLALQNLGDPAGAERQYRRAIALDTMYAEAFFYLGTLLATHSRNQEAEEMYLRAIQIAPGFSTAFYNLACLKSTEGNFETAFLNLEKAMQLGGLGQRLMLEDPDLTPLRALPEWKELMKKYFPDKVKD